MNKRAYMAGAWDATKRFTSNPKNLDLMGLGLLAAPVTHSLLTDTDNESKTTSTAKHIAELAGLGLLTRATWLGKH